MEVYFFNVKNLLGIYAALRFSTAHSCMYTAVQKVQYPVTGFLVAAVESV